MAWETRVRILVERFSLLMSKPSNTFGEDQRDETQPCPPVPHPHIFKWTDGKVETISVVDSLTRTANFFFLGKVAWNEGAEGDKKFQFPVKICREWHQHWLDMCSLYNLKMQTRGWWCFSMVWRLWESSRLRKIDTMPLRRVKLFYSSHQ